MGLIQAYERALAEQPAAGSCRRHALAGGRRGRARALIRAFDRHGVWLLQAGA